MGKGGVGLGRVGHGGVGWGVVGSGRLGEGVCRLLFSASPNTSTTSSTLGTFGKSLNTLSSISLSANPVPATMRAYISLSFLNHFPQLLLVVSLLSSWSIHKVFPSFCGRWKSDNIDYFI